MVGTIACKASEWVGCHPVRRFRCYHRSPMPRSKSKRRRYQAPPKKKPKPSPKWFGWTILGIMGVGVVMIVLNYLGLLPGEHGTANNLYLFLGLGLIAIGFLMSTVWR